MGNRTFALVNQHLKALRHNVAENVHPVMNVHLTKPALTINVEILALDLVESILYVMYDYTVQCVHVKMVTLEIRLHLVISCLKLQNILIHAIQRLAGLTLSVKNPD